MSRGMCEGPALPQMPAPDWRRAQESPAWEAGAVARRESGVLKPLLQNWKLLLYVVVLMTAFNFFSHGTQDTYATFLQSQHGFTPQMTGMLTAASDVYSLGVVRCRALVLAGPGRPGTEKGARG